MTTTAALDYHLAPRPGKIEVRPTKPLAGQDDLALAYTPGVADACLAIAADEHDAYRYTSKGHLVAVVSNGTAVLGLGNLGPAASKPVMEGKANLFKRFADIDVFDLELDATTVDDVVRTVRALAPTFGGINLEDIKAPECFAIEAELQRVLPIPVFHDDQHGTAVIAGAALVNGLALTDRSIDALKVVVSGAGAAALACLRHFEALGLPPGNAVVFDSRGGLHRGRGDLSSSKAAVAVADDPGTLAQALAGADLFLGVSAGNLLTPEMLTGMAPRPIVLALANPTPEIDRASALTARPDAIVATGRSDTPNQVNNVLGFPYIFRGALDVEASSITPGMLVAATEALADLARQPVPASVLAAHGTRSLEFGPDYLIPKPFDGRLLATVSSAVARAAMNDGVARRPLPDLDRYRAELAALSRAIAAPR